VTTQTFRFSLFPSILVFAPDSCGIIALLRFRADAQGAQASERLSEFLASIAQRGPEGGAASSQALHQEKRPFGPLGRLRTGQRRARAAQVVVQENNARPSLPCPAASRPGLHRGRAAPCAAPGAPPLGRPSKTTGRTTAPPFPAQAETERRAERNDGPGKRTGALGPTGGRAVAVWSPPGRTSDAARGHRAPVAVRDIMHEANRGQGERPLGRASAPPREATPSRRVKGPAPSVSGGNGRAGQREGYAVAFFCIEVDMMCGGGVRCFFPRHRSWFFARHDPHARPEEDVPYRRRTGSGTCGNQS
jgi:hypothetical protein